MELFNFSSLKTKYFWIAVILMGSAGIWLPILLSLALGENINTKEIPINLTTFYISIYFAGCVDAIFNSIDILDNKYELKSKLFTIIFLILVSVALVISTVWLKIKDYYYLPLSLSFLGTFLGLRLWWNNNSKDNPTFSDVVRGESNNKHGKSWQK